MASEPRIGLVAIGRNEGERLKASLRSVPAGVPMVYVDSASTDGSAEFARSVGAHVVDLDLSQPFTAARARNEGARLLETIAPHLEYVQFVDGDCEIEARWLQAAATRLDQRTELAAVCGRRSEKYPDASFYNAMCDAEWNTPVGEAEACGGDAMFRLAAFRRVGGFDPSLIAHEEPDLCARLRALGFVIERIDAPMTRHDAAITRFGQFWRRNTRAGYGYAQSAAKHRGSAYDPSRGLLRRTIQWGIAIPAACLVLTLAAWPWGLASWLVFPLQIARRATMGGLGWRPAAFELVQKFAEAEGFVKWLLDRVRNRSRNAIQYK